MTPEQLRDLPHELVYPQVDDDLMTTAKTIYWAGDDEYLGFAIALQHIRDGRLPWLLELASCD